MTDYDTHPIDFGPAKSDGPLVARADFQYRWRVYVFFIMLFGYGLWSARDGFVKWPSVTTRSIVADCDGKVSPARVTTTLTLPPPTVAAVSVRVASATLTASCGPENVIAPPAHVVHGDTDSPALPTTAIVPFEVVASMVTSALYPAM